jgi:hypothetical protein
VRLSITALVYIIACLAIPKLCLGYRVAANPGFGSSYQTS